MKEVNALKQVVEFHEIFNQPFLKSPGIPAQERCDLRVELLVEEVQELATAVKNKDLIEIADALCDIQYVLSGAIIEFGLGEKFKDLFDEVHRSNLSKACKNIEEANKTVEYYKNNRNQSAYWSREGDHIIVYRTADNKVLKSIRYSGANLKDIIFKIE